MITHMPLLTPNLDDRTFQQIVDEAKRRITHHCPEWTDHNVSDPGVALIELFAWMTEMLLYRVNQVPDKMYIKFLEMIGIKPAPPIPARVPVTFYVAEGHKGVAPIPKGTEVATIRTETDPAVIFVTENEINIYQPKILAAYTSNEKMDKSVKHDLVALNADDKRQIFLFQKQQEEIPSTPDRHSKDELFKPGAAFYLKLENDHSQNTIELKFICGRIPGGIRPGDPPIVWEVYQGEEKGWQKCKMEDRTLGFSQNGSVILDLPEMFPGLFFHSITPAYWLRCHYRPESNQPTYTTSPILKSFHASTLAGVAVSCQAVKVTEELLGYSDGTTGQTFKLQNFPVLECEPADEFLTVDSEDWQEVAHFGDSSEQNNHYTLDHLDGTLTLGPALLQPNGELKRYGKVPPKGSRLLFKKYRYGGGVNGNVPIESISIMKSAIPYVTHIVNRAPATGGRDAESLEDIKLRAASYLRSGERAVTVEDFESQACKTPGISRARCLAPGAQPEKDEMPKPGQVHVLLLTEAVPRTDKLRREPIPLTDDLKNSVLENLQRRSIPGLRISIEEVEITRVKLGVVLVVPTHLADSFRKAIVNQAEDVLHYYLNPYTGGPEGKGWPFGKQLHVSEIYQILQHIPGVEYVKDVSFKVSKSDGTFRAADLPLSPREGVICSADHDVRVTTE